MLVVNTNVSSLNAQRNLNVSGKLMNKSLERLSSGLRINRAADDAAGLAISEGLRSQVRGLNQAVRNANDGISLLSVAESSMVEMTNMLQRMRELSVQAANDVNSTANRTALQAEVDELSAEIDRVVDTIEFNGQALLDGPFAAKFLHVGANASQTIQIDISALDAATLGVDAASLDLSTNALAGAAITSVDAALDTLNTERADLGAKINRLESTVSNLMTVSENLAASDSRIRDADFASETATLTKAQILQQAGTAILAQANVTPQAALSLLG